MRLWWHGRWEAVDGHGAFLERKGGRQRRARGRWRFRNAMVLLAVLGVGGPGDPAKVEGGRPEAAGGGVVFSIAREAPAAGVPAVAR